MLKNVGKIMHKDPHEQEDPDVYVHLVEEKDDGICKKEDIPEFL